MDYEIIPSMLPVEGSLQEWAEKLKSHVKSIHIDVMDGIFVEENHFSVEDVENLNTPLKKIVHLMVIDPEKEITEYALAGSDTLIFHIEAAKDPAALIQKIKDEKVKAGISLKPETHIEAITPFLKDIDCVLVMTVEPGLGGQEFIPAMQERIKKLRQLAPELDIMVDGGVNMENIKRVKESGANVFIVGTGIFRAEDPVKALEDLKSAIK